MNTSWLWKPHASAIARTGRLPVSNSAAAWLRRRREPNCFGVSPAAAENTRCRWNGDSLARSANADSGTSSSSRAADNAIADCAELNGIFARGLFNTGLGRDSIRRQREGLTILAAIATSV